MIDDVDARKRVGYLVWLFSDYFPLAEAWWREAVNWELN